jgi:hypothetical protein
MRALRRQGDDKRLLGLTLGDIGLTYYELGRFFASARLSTTSRLPLAKSGDRRTKSISYMASANYGRRPAKLRGRSTPERNRRRWRAPSVTARPKGERS